MCRAFTDTDGRRCPCDTSEARRLRRHNAQARNNHVIEKPLTETGTNITAPVSPEPDYSVGGAKVQEVKSNIRQLELLQSLLNREQGVEVPEVITLPTGETLKLEENGYDMSVYNQEGHIVSTMPKTVILATYAEKMTVYVGSQVNEIVEARTGISDEAIKEADDLELAKLQPALDEAQANHKAHWDAIKEQYGSMDNFWNVYRTNDEEAIKLSVQSNALLNILEKARAPYNKIAERGSQEAWEKVAKKREVLIETLKEIRPLGGEMAVADNSHKNATAILQKAMEVYPSSWLESSAKKSPPRIKKTTKRAHYTDGKFQNYFKLRPAVDVVLRDENWKPDPETIEGVGKWVKLEANQFGEWEYKDPETGRTRITHYGSPGQVGWAREKVEFAQIWGDPEHKPHGKGWVRADVEDTKYDFETRTHTVVGKRPVWYRTVKKRERVESVQQPELTISGADESSQTRVALHEAAHRIESTPGTGSQIKRLEEQFLVRRTTDPVTGERENLQTIYKGTKEKGRPDNFVDLYMGKEYDEQGYREVLSTGAEAIFHNSFGGLIGLGRRKPDADMKNFIVGLWASVK